MSVRIIDPQNASSRNSARLHVSRSVPSLSWDVQVRLGKPNHPMQNGQHAKRAYAFLSLLGVGSKRYLLVHRTEKFSLDCHAYNKQHVTSVNLTVVSRFRRGSA